MGVHVKRSKSESFIEKWYLHQFSSGCCTGEDYIQFQKEARAVIHEQASKGGYELFNFNKNHYCFSCVLKHRETGAFAYISVSDVRYFRNQWCSHILYRQMRHEKDWTGGDNHYTELLDLGECLSNLYPGLYKAAS